MGRGGTPTVPGLPAPPAEDDQPADAAEPDEPGLPPELAALVDVGSMSSVSRSVYDDTRAASTATSRAADVALLGGLITVDAVRVSTRSASVLGKATATSTARFGGLAVAGRAFTVGPDGVEGTGAAQPLPGLPADAAEALKTLGVRVTVPEERKSVTGSRALLAREGLRVEVDTRALRSRVDSGALDEVIRRMPDESGELKSLLGALAQATPKIVIYLGSAAGVTDALPQITFPPLPTAPGIGGAGEALPELPSDAAAGTAPMSGPAPAEPVAASGSAAEPRPLIAPTAAGLPPLGSVPGMLLLGGILVAAAVGWWLHRAGRLVLGGGSVCEHGLATGVPDLRKG